VSDATPRGLVVVNNQVQLQPCALYASHKVPIINAHHICPLSWWIAAGKPVNTPMAQLCPNCHAAAHTAIDGLLANRDVSLRQARPSGADDRCRQRADSGTDAVAPSTCPGRFGGRGLLSYPGCGG
jgi:hypothetical protein